MDTTKQELIAKIESRVADKALERSNADLLIKLINNADSIDEAISIAALGTMYKRTGLHFDPRLEKMSNTIKYFEKNEALSFTTPGAKRTHKLIIGDNYDALQNLLIQYKGKIDVIYIDPPYGKDSMGEFADTNYDNAITRDNLLSMLYPRLILAKQLLTEEGVIFCSLDDKNQAYVKCLMDEIFGERNFINNFMWLHGKGKKDSWSRTLQQYTLTYAKNKNSLGEWVDKSYTNYDFTNPDNDPKGKWFSGSLSFSETRSNPLHPNYYTIVSPTGVKWTRQWQVTKEEMDSLIENGDISWGDPQKMDGVPRQKIRPCEIDIIPNNIITDKGTTKSAQDDLDKIGLSVHFDYPKPVELIKHLISITNKAKDIVILDFFAGSGTTGHAVLDLNAEDGGSRSYILCQMNEQSETTREGIAYDVTSKRLKRIMTGECYDGSKDFEWIKKNKPYGDNLDVYEIKMVADNAQEAGQTPFDLIDETLYGKEKFATKREKIEWVCQNFQRTEKYLEE